MHNLEFPGGNLVLYSKKGLFNSLEGNWVFFLQYFSTETLLKQIKSLDRKRQTILINAQNPISIPANATPR